MTTESAPSSTDGSDESTQHVDGVAAEAEESPDLAHVYSDLAKRWAELGELDPSARAAEQSSGLEDTAPGPADDTTGSRGRGLSLRRRGLRHLLVPLLVIVLVVATAILGWRDYRLGQIDQARQDATSAASKDAVTMATYSYTSLSKNFRSVEAQATSTFARQFAKSSAALTPVLTQYKASSSASVVTAGTSSATSSKVVVLVYLNQTVRNNTTPTPTTERNRLVLTMVHQDGKWLVDQLTLK